MRIAVRFLRGWTPYQAGEVATFDPALALELIKDGVAEKVKDVPDEASGPKAKG